MIINLLSLPLIAKTNNVNLTPKTVAIIIFAPEKYGSKKAESLDLRNHKMSIPAQEVKEQSIHFFFQTMERPCDPRITEIMAYT